MLHINTIFAGVFCLWGVWHNYDQMRSKLSINFDKILECSNKTVSYSKYNFANIFENNSRYIIAACCKNENAKTGSYCVVHIPVVDLVTKDFVEIFEFGVTNESINITVHEKIAEAEIFNILEGSRFVMKPSQKLAGLNITQSMLIEISDGATSLYIQMIDGEWRKQFFH